MDKKEIQTKLARAFTVALPILLVAILALLVIIAMDIARENSVPVLGGGIDTTTTTTSGNGGDPDADKPQDEPIEDPSSKGLAFVSNGDGTCSLEGLGSCEDSFIIVPMESPDGDIVTDIADNAFKNCTSIRGIELCETIRRIGAYAFYGSSIREIEIPSGVREIGNYAFSGCKSLVEINVDKSSSKFSSSAGVLYNKDGSILIAYPAGKTDNSIVIGREVVEIANMAFYKCSYIKRVTYHGTSASWRAVEIGAGNDIIEEAIVYCSGDTDK